MTSTRSEAAWADFWRSGGAGPESGCLPLGLQGIDAAQRAVWEGVARQLRRGARVLDLATGDGAVLGKIRRVRSDLKLVGVDSSPVLRPSPKGVTLTASVSMESLPFDDASFDFVTSQFGFEYGETASVAREVRRVLRTDGGFAFIVHHAGGRIVAHNRGRSEALAWASQESGLLEKAEALARARGRIDLPTPAAFREAPAEARRRFPRQGVGEEFATAVLQTLELGRRAPFRETLEVLGTLKARAGNELARVRALGHAARDREQITLLIEELEQAGLEVEPPTTLCEDNEAEPFAWLLRGRPGPASSPAAKARD